ncbi:MAG: aldehyde dehydrogenase family protein [Pseudomonadota bacterium]
MAVLAATDVGTTSIQDRFETLRGATLKLRNSSAQDRASRLEALWAATVKHKDAIFKAGAAERRTHDLDVAAELVMIKGEIDFAVKNVARWIKPEKVKGSMATLGKKCEIRRQSKGVVLNMAAFNAPTAEAIVPAIAAIAAGNAIAIKPSELAPASAEVIADIFEDALPADEAAVFLGGVDVAETLLTLPFNHIYYTGGMTVGRIVMKAAAEHFASITLEMGGKSPVIVDKTADLENAATKIAWGRVMNAGQVCVAPEYVLVHESVEADLLKLLKEKITELYNADGSGFQASPYMPRIINERHQTRIKGLIDDAVSKGATVYAGGGADTADRYIEPTILTGLTEDMSVMKEEVFGPVLSVLPWREKEDVLRLIEPRPNPLALYIYSKDQQAVEYFLTNTSSGSAVVNNNCIQSGTNPHLPFGGVGASGMGRIGGYEGFKTMSNERSVVHQPLDRLRDMLIQLPPYSERYSKLIMSALK